jgi:hypothetical protein
MGEGYNLEVLHAKCSKWNVFQQRGCEEFLHTFNIHICTHKTRLEVELLCTCSLTSTVVQGNVMKLTKNLMRCVHLDDTKTLWENCKFTMMEYEGHYFDVHSMSCLMVEPFLFH